MAGISISSFLYPKALTNDAWQKAKGKIGKLTKTGLGEALDAAEAAFKKIDIQTLDPASNPLKTQEALDAAVAASKKEYAQKMPALVKALNDVVSAADDAAAKLKKTLGGGDAAKAALAVKKEAENFRVASKSLDLEASIQKVQADIARKNELAAKLLNDSLKKFVQGAAAFLKDPTWASWGDNVKQQGRSVSNSVAQLQDYRARFWRDFEKFKGFDLNTLGLSSDDPQVSDKMVKIVKLAIAQVKEIAAFKG